MTGDDLRPLLMKARQFFEKFEYNIKEQLDIFESGRARADSAAMSEWLDRVYLANIVRSKAKISEFESYSAEDLEAKQATILQKVMDYLSRAKEALEDAKASTEVSAKFIPVPAHQAFDEKNAALLETVEAILNDPLLESQGSSAKTWFTNALHRVSSFIQIRTNSFGLNKPTHDQSAKDNLRELSTYLNALDVAPAENTTKTTQKMLGEQHRYIPEQMNACLIQFRALQDNGEATSKAAVMDVMTPSFPNPRPQ